MPRALALSVALVFAAAPGRASPDDLAQLILVGARGTEVVPGGELEKLICRLKVGGIVLYGKDAVSGGTRNIVSPPQLRRLTREMQALAVKCGNAPLIIAVDMEGGPYSHLDPRDGFPSFPGHGRLGARPPDAAFRAAAKMGRLLRDVGVNVDLAPVLDVALDTGNVTAANPGRAFSDDPESVAAHAAAFVRGLHSQGILAVLKHYPGYEAARFDPHSLIPDATGENRSSRDDIPYRRLIDSGLADAVMMGHIVNKTVDPEFPASLSSAAIQGALRGRLGFDGLVVSDDLGMQGLASRYPIAESPILAVRAGVDLLIVSNNGPVYDPALAFKVAAGLTQAVANGELSENRAREALERVRRFKQKLTAEVPYSVGADKNSILAK